MTRSRNTLCAVVPGHDLQHKSRPTIQERFNRNLCWRGSFLGITFAVFNALKRFDNMTYQTLWHGELSHEASDQLYYTSCFFLIIPRINHA